MTLEKGKEAIQKKPDKVTKELEKVKKAAAGEIGNFNDAEDHAILKAIVGTTMSMTKAAGACTRCRWWLF